MNENIASVSSVFYILFVLVVSSTVLYLAYKFLSIALKKASNLIARVIRFSRASTFSRVVLILSLIFFFSFCYFNWNNIRSKHLASSSEEYAKISIAFASCMMEGSKLSYQKINCINALQNDNTDSFATFYAAGSNNSECIMKDKAACEVKKLLVPELDCTSTQPLKITEDDKQAYFETRTKCKERTQVDMSFVKYLAAKKLSILLGYLQIIMLYFAMPFCIAHLLLWYLVNWIKTGKIK